MTKGRFLSPVVAIGYMAAAFFGGGWESIWRASIFLILPLPCFSFGDEIGSYTGIGRDTITCTSPGWLVAAGGWLLLLMPVILALVMPLTQTVT